MNILITGGCGFIGSHVVDKFIQEKHNIIVVDKLTYAGNIDFLNPKAKLIQIDIGDSSILEILMKHSIDIIINLAAETHVDNSIQNPFPFLETNVNATFRFLHNCMIYQNNHNHNAKFVHISTDEVFGDLRLEEPAFDENSPYNPSSPYSSSKAAGDMLIQAYKRTYNFNSIILNCTNNFGPRQHHEKLIPKTILKCLLRQPIPIYGNGQNIREWTFVKDFAEGIHTVAMAPHVSDRYCIGSGNEMQNITIVTYICEILSKKLQYDCTQLIQFVTDRQGHDYRYAINSNKIKNELQFKLDETNFHQQLIETIEYEYEKFQSLNRQDKLISKPQ